MISTSLIACALLVLAAAVADIAARSIPNSLTLGGVVVGLVIQTAAGAADGPSHALAGFAFGLVGTVSCALLPFWSWRRGELGGGDVKLFAAVGALLGPLAGFEVQATTFILSGLVIFPWRLVRNGALRPALANLRIGLYNALPGRRARLAYAAGPKLPPMILAPTIALAFAVLVIRQAVSS